MREFVFYPEGNEESSVKAWIHDHQGSKEIKQRAYPAIVICPGGGYEMLSDREAEIVAEPFYAAGYNTFVLRYSLKEKASGFRPLGQLAATVAQIRKNAEEWFTKEDRIVVSGFSAGGHLAGSLGVLFNKPEVLTQFENKELIRPNAMILCYPVITSDEYAHAGSIERASGAAKGTERYRWFGLDQHVDAQTPPTFLWHTAQDELVPVENSLKMAEALSKAKVPFEFHVFPKGPHGMSTCTEEVDTPSAHNARWVQWSIQWLQELWKIAQN